MRQCKQKAWGRKCQATSDVTGPYSLRSITVMPRSKQISQQGQTRDGNKAELPNKRMRRLRLNNNWISVSRVKSISKGRRY